MTEERDSGRKRRASDVPVDLAKEREAFVRQFIRRGVELTEELIAENEALRERIAAAEEDNARLRTQVASDDAIRDLVKRIDELEGERRRLLDRSTTLERDRREDETRVEKVEAELSDLANLYIASYQLHASLSLRRVVRHLKDTIGQLVGAYSFVIYVIDPGQNRVVPLGWEELEENEVQPLPLGEGAVGDVCLTGIPRVREDFGEGSLEDPIAIIPLMVGEQPIGAISIVRMLEQKKAWASVDRELFKLVGAHGGTALVAANLFAGVSRPEDALDGLFENLLRRPSGGPPSEGE